MKCEVCRELMVEYLRGELDDQTREAVEEHLSQCVACARELQGARRVLELADAAEKPPVVELVQTLLTRAIEEGASDIHIEPRGDEVVVRYRIDGVLHEVMRLPDHVQHPLATRLKILANLPLDKPGVPMFGRFRVRYGEHSCDLRLSSLPTIGGECLVLRLLVEGSALPALDGLGLLEVSLEELRHLLTRPAGLVVVGGPAGSGRTTLLNSILRHLERPEISLYSIEDPVTVRLEGVTQVCVDRGAGLDFATALRHVLRHDPDIIMCGEVADGESADLSARAAVTGHLVLASLYALDAASVPRRLLELGLERFWVREALLGATSQRLLRTLCTDCRRERETTAAEADWLRAAGLDEPPGAVYEPVGCPNCRGTGYRGRTLVVEVLVMDDELGRALMECADLREFEALARTHLAPMRRHAAEKVVAGLTSVLEASRVLD